MRSQNRAILILVLIAFVVMCAFIAFKWSRWGYTGLDVAIYTQAMDQTVQGRFMNLTIHPHSYFGDHIELLLLVLLPFYALVQHPVTLLVLQAAALCAGAFAVASLARKRFPTSRAPVWAAAAYLIHPFVLNPLAYEFHALTFAIPLLLFTLVAYDQHRWRWFVVGMVASLLVREDVGLALIGLGLMAWAHHRSWRWRIVPMVLGIVWLGVMLKVAGHLNGEGQYKFLQYYAWLGESLPEMIRTALTRPWIVLWHLVSPSRIATLLGILLAYAFLPMLALRTMVGLLPILIQLLLLGIGENGLRIHYTALISPILILATLDALKRISNSVAPARLAIVRKEKEIALLMLTVVLVAASVIIGPASGLVQDWWGKRFDPGVHGVVAGALHNELPRRVPVVASFRPIQRLAQSDDVYSLHYVYMGHRQYADDLPYPVSPAVQTVVIDDRDLLLYQHIYPEKDFPEGFARIRQFMADRQLRLTQQIGHRFTYQASAAPPTLPLTPTRQVVTDTLSLVGQRLPTRETQAIGKHSFPTLAFALEFNSTQKLDRNYQLRFTVKDERGTLPSELYTLNPLMPTGDWEPNTPYRWEYHPVLTRQLVGLATVRVEVVKVLGQGGLDGMRGIAIQNQIVTPLGQAIELPVTN